MAQVLVASFLCECVKITCYRTSALWKINMYGHERFVFPLPRPSPLYIPQPSTMSGNVKGLPARIEMDDYAYRPELPQSSTDDSTENKNELLSSSDMRDFSSCFTSCMAPISSPSISCFMSAGSEQRLFDNEGTHTECNGVREDDGRKEREHKKRSKNWTRLETLKLIKERSEIDAKFGRMGRKAELWDAIAESLRRESFVRDGQQCKDKWEKLSAGYKEVRDGIRDKEQFPYFDELHMLAFERLKRRERENEIGLGLLKDKHEAGSIDELDLGGPFASTMAAYADVQPEQSLEEQILPNTKRKEPTHGTAIDLSAVQELMEMLLAKQQKFFVDILNAVERREQAKEQIRQEREDRWRAEERAQRRILNNVMVLLAQKLLDAHSGPGMSSLWTGNESALDVSCRLKKKHKFCKQ